MKAANSLFFVEVMPRHLLQEEKARSRCEEKYYEFTTAVEENENARGVELLANATKAGTAERYSTGFVIAAKGNTLRILTCAHSMEDVFTSGISRSTKDVNSVFRFDVHCVHHESKVVNMRSTVRPSDRQKSITPALAIAVDTKLDLLILEVELDRVKCNKEERCSNEHPVIKVSPSDPTKLSKLTLIGWPPQRCSFLATGQVSVWTYDAVSGLNNKGYTMRLLEVHGLLAASGFSGGMIMNDQSDCVALYHGVLNKMGYGVSHQDLNSFLAKHKVVSTTSKHVTKGSLIKAYAN